MKIIEIVEVVSNKGKIIDMLKDDRELPREIRQVYNKIRRKRNILPDKKRYTKNWAQYLLTIDSISHNDELSEMLMSIIEICSAK